VLKRTRATADPCGMTNKRTHNGKEQARTTATAKAKCGGLSAAAANARLRSG
jgi:hypothetical protein